MAFTAGHAVCLLCKHILFYFLFFSLLTNAYCTIPFPFSLWFPPPLAVFFSSNNGSYHRQEPAASAITLISVPEFIGSATTLIKSEETRLFLFLAPPQSALIENGCHSPAPLVPWRTVFLLNITSRQRRAWVMVSDTQAALSREISSPPTLPACLWASEAKRTACDRKVSHQPLSLSVL